MRLLLVAGGCTNPHPFAHSVRTAARAATPNEMRSHLILVALTLSLTLGGFVRADTPRQKSDTDLALAGWICDPQDNICGISDPRKVSNPALVNYQVLLEATPAIREMRRDRIDPDSAKGRQLRRAAAELITKASEAIRRARGHCGVWRVIRHEDGRIVPDVTSDVRDRF